MHTSSPCLDDECIALWFSKRRTFASPLPVVSAKQPYLFSNRQPFAWIGVRIDVQIANSACATEDVSGQHCPHIQCEFGLTACTTCVRLVEYESKLVRACTSICKSSLGKAVAEDS